MGRDQPAHGLAAYKERRALLLCTRLLLHKGIQIIHLSKHPDESCLAPSVPVVKLILSTICMQDAVDGLRMTHIVAEALHKCAVPLCAGFRLPVPVRIESVHCDAARCQCAEVYSDSMWCAFRYGHAANHVSDEHVPTDNCALHAHMLRYELYIRQLTVPHAADVLAIAVVMEEHCPLLTTSTICQREQLLAACIGALVLCGFTRCRGCHS
jgi:hypothetical protein